MFVCLVLLHTLHGFVDNATVGRIRATELGAVVGKTIKKSCIYMNMESMVSGDCNPGVNQICQIHTTWDVATPISMLTYT